MERWLTSSFEDRTSRPHHIVATLGRPDMGVKSPQVQMGQVDLGGRALGRVCGS